jgi:exonuclease VII large subunit
MSAMMRQYADRLGMSAGLLEALSPLLQLDRGYVIASQHQGGAGLISTAALKPGDHLWLRFDHGQARAQVEDVDS